MKLTIELVPQTAWHNNMRSLMGKAAWDILRKKIYKEFNYHCGICGASEKLDCHELWEYDDQVHSQTLKGFIALCQLCHAVKHIGLASLKKNIETVEAHFMKVNKCDRLTFLQHKRDAFAIFEERSKHPWQLNIGNHKNIGSII